MKGGGHMRSQIEGNNRKCFHCKDKIENECPFVISCPLYSVERQDYSKCAEKILRIFETLDDEQKFTFLMSNENECPLVTEMSVQFIFNSFKICDKVVNP